MTDDVRTSIGRIRAPQDVDGAPQALDELRCWQASTQGRIAHSLVALIGSLDDLHRLAERPGGLSLLDQESSDIESAEHLLFELALKVSAFRARREAKGLVASWDRRGAPPDPACDNCDRRSPTVKEVWAVGTESALCATCRGIEPDEDDQGACDGR
jgi:hypothetical protein